MGLQEVIVTRNQSLVGLILFVLALTAGAVWQFGPYGLYGGGLLVIAILSFTDIDKPTKGGDSG